jgi:hypothetical protein
MFYDYQVRIHSDSRRDDDVKKWLDSRGEQWYCAYEKNANRAHYQMYLKSKYKEQSLRRYIKEEFKLEGNRMYSISLLRKEVKDLVCYLMKEGDLVSKKISAEVVAQAEAQAKEIQDTKNPRTRPRTTVQKIMSTIDIDDPTPKQLRVYVYAYFYKNGKMLPDGFMVEKYVRTIQAYTGGWEAIRDLIYDDLWQDATARCDPSFEKFIQEKMMTDREF